MTEFQEPTPPMKILAFAASNSRRSINRALIDFAALRLEADILPEAEVELLDLNAFEMPIYSIDRERDSGVPQPAQDFYAKIGSADAILVSFAEHNGFVTAAWKNIFDWMSRIELTLWQGKPLVILAATPGRRAGANVLKSQELLAPHFGADFRGSLGIGTWAEAWDPVKKRLVRDSDLEALDATLKSLVRNDQDALALKLK
ncbi:MAG: NAD(P)H-dependent oxidoreductase [Pseudomonadota bacterium]